MGKLRKFEIDAIIGELTDAAKEKNKELLVNFDESQVDEKLESEYSDIKEYFDKKKELEEAQTVLNSLSSLLKTNYKDKINIVNSWGGLLSETAIRDNIKKELQKDLGLIQINHDVIERKIILHGQSNLTECLNSIKEELGL